MWNLSSWPGCDPAFRVLGKQNSRFDGAPELYGARVPNLRQDVLIAIGIFGNVSRVRIHKRNLGTAGRQHIVNQFTKTSSRSDL